MVKKNNDINFEKLRSTLLSMASMFETGRIKRMKDITTMYPSGVRWALGMNFGGYMAKCASPEKFVMSDIIKLANLLKIDLNLILNVIVSEAQKNVEPKDISHFFTENN